MPGRELHDPFQFCHRFVGGSAHLIYLGQDQPDKIAFAFQQGAQSLSYAAQVELRLLPAAKCELGQLDTALNRLCQAVPQIKKNVLNACAQTVAADGVIQGMEAELLRAIADTLDCPMPPLIPDQTDKDAPGKRTGEDLAEVGN